MDVVSITPGKSGIGKGSRVHFELGLVSLDVVSITLGKSNIGGVSRVYFELSS